jgi:MFS family permease
MMLTLGVALFAMFFFMTQYLQNVRGYSAARTGLEFLPMSAAIMVAAIGTSRLLVKIGVRPPLLLGPFLALLGDLLLTRLTVGSSYLAVIGPLVLIAFGMGQSFVPLTVTVMSGVAPGEAGLASALLNTGQQVGGALGLAVLGTIAISARRAYVSAAVAAHHAVTRAVTNAATVHGYTRGFVVGSAIVAGALVISLLVVRAPKSVATPSTAVPPVLDPVGG